MLIPEYTVLTIIRRRNVHEKNSKYLYTKPAILGLSLINLPVILIFNLLSSPVVHGLKVTLLKTQSRASAANFLCVALNMPNIPKTINAIMQII